MSKIETPSGGKQFPGQHEGEIVQFFFRQHPLVMRKALIIGLLVVMFAILPLDFYGIWYTDTGLYHSFIKVALIAPVLVFLVWFYRWVGWYYTMYLVTDKRILAIAQKGLFDRQVDEWQLSDISNVNYHVGGLQAMLFGYGDITARTYIGDLLMTKIHKPAEIHERLVKAVRKAGGGSTQLPN